MPVTHKIVSITPDMARAMLARNDANRPLGRSRYSRMADDMRAGRWNYNGQDLLVASDGVLLDGQHRLAAIILADMPVTMGIKHGLPRKVFSTIDSGAGRTAADVLSISGVKNYSTVAAAARIALLFESGYGLNSGMHTRAAVTQYALAHPYIAELVHDLGRGRATGLTPGPIVAVLSLGNMTRMFDDEVASFIDGVRTGEGLSVGSPILTLRNWALAERIRTRGYIPTHSSFAAVARCWTAHALGEQLFKLQSLKRPSKFETTITGYEPGVAEDDQ